MACSKHCTFNIIKITLFNHPFVYKDFTSHNLGSPLALYIRDSMEDIEYIYSQWFQTPHIQTRSCIQHSHMQLARNSSAMPSHNMSTDEWNHPGWVLSNHCFLSMKICCSLDLAVNTCNRLTAENQVCHVWLTAACYSDAFKYIVY